ncbi:MAG: DUF368 domain-containing protein [Eubacteriales bacterium]|nr:DUF368 domain-containing protein [Eubacteriales bacterium]
MLVPGVSGGSMAMILGIYEDLITAVSRFFKQKTKSIIFLGIFCIGAFSGMALFAKSLLKLLNTYNMPMMYLFIGCIVGGIPMIIKSCQLERLSVSTAIYPIIGAVIVLSITLIPHGIFGTFNGFTFQSALILFIAGFFAAIALILPGISVSFVLLVLGIYEQLIKAFNDFNIIYLGIIGAGLVFGIISTTKILEYAMNKHKRPTYLIILGFIIGSVIPVFPGAPHGIDIFICPIALIIGIALIQLLFKLDSSQ